MKYIFLLFLFPSALVFGQQTRISGNFSFPPEKISRNTIDSTQYIITYEYEIVKNKKREQQKSIGTAQLLIGKKFLKFQDEKVGKSDSLKYSFQNLKSLGVNEVNQLLSLRAFFPYTVYVVIAKKSYKLDTSLLEWYSYKDTLPKISWNIFPETKMIGTYKAQKAKGNYAGREYEAWFSTEIPFAYGPYIFNGLPGLILEIKDNKNHYIFTVSHITSKRIPIYEYERPKVFHINKAKFQEIERTFYENPSRYTSEEAMDSNGNPIQLHRKPRPYNPIELK